MKYQVAIAMGLFCVKQSWKKTEGTDTLKSLGLIFLTLLRLQKNQDNTGVSILTESVMELKPIFYQECGILCGNHCGIQCGKECGI